MNENKDTIVHFIDLQGILAQKIIQDNNFMKSVISALFDVMDYSEDELIEMIKKGGLVF